MSKLLGLLLCLACGVSAAEQPVITRVDVFVSDATPVAAGAESVALAKQGKLSLWNLDDLERLHQKLGAGLPRDQAAAVKLVAQRAASLSTEDQVLLNKAANGRARADGFKIERVPAVLINEAHVYYGARSIEMALDAYRSGK